MRDDLPSITAAAVAYARAVASTNQMLNRPVGDDIARQLVPSLLAKFVPTRGGVAVPLRQKLIRVTTAGLIDHIALRTCAIDEAVNAALAENIQQLVLLGAGLDARAYRLDRLSDVTVFEVDHPATHQYKRRRTASLKASCRELKSVAIDFARESLDTVLAAAGHDAKVPTAWIWEGVTMYLPHEATVQTMGAITQRSATGSRLMMTYMTPLLVEAKDPARVVTRAAFGVLGEPLIGAMTTTECHKLLSSSGFEVLQDGNNQTWARAFDGNEHLPIFYRGEHLVVAQRL